MDFKPPIVTLPNGFERVDIKVNIPEDKIPTRLTCNQKEKQKRKNSNKTVNKNMHALAIRDMKSSHFPRNRNKNKKTRITPLRKKVKDIGDDSIPTSISFFVPPPLARLNIDLIRGNEVEPSKCVTCYD
jgi:hypothetical protein